jgi:hypothetical protein
MYVCMYTYIYIRTYLIRYRQTKSITDYRSRKPSIEHTDIHTHTHTPTHTHTNVHTHVCTRTYIHPSIHTYIHTYIHIYIHPSIHTYIYTHTHTDRYMPFVFCVLSDTLLHTCAFCPVLQLHKQLSLAKWWQFEIKRNNSRTAVLICFFKSFYISIYNIWTANCSLLLLCTFFRFWITILTWVIVTCTTPSHLFTNQKSKNQHMHYILTSKSLTPTYVSASTSHLQGIKVLHTLDIH